MSRNTFTGVNYRHTGDCYADYNHYRRNISSIFFFRNSEALASEFLENIEE